ncbi:MAG TPA: DNA internalization-related competence protein ComEC/Rec2 [Myxococcota bacterium]|nr:DNA internalization-related competence protein ComEC/Rec2 [Myxococcota bacterium]
MVVGVWLWPHWQPEVSTLLLGVGALGVCALFGRRVAPLAAWSAALLVGSAAPGLHDGARPRAEAYTSVTGVVYDSGGHRASLRTEDGPIEVWLPDPAPPAGSTLAAFGRLRPDWELHLPGEPDPVLRARTAGLRNRLLATDWTSDAPPRARPFPAAEHEGLLQALAFGDRSLVREEDVALLQRTGTIHLLAISGLHVGLLAALAAGLATLFVRPLALLHHDRLVRLVPVFVGLGVAWAFAHFVGWPVSARRATWMVAGALVGSASGRGVRPWNLLGIAAALVAIGDPGAVRGLGFGLSFGAVLGILTVSPRLERYLPPDSPRLLRWGVRSVGATLGATLGTLPMTAWTFQQLPLAAPLANLVAVPLVGWVALPGSLLASRGNLLPMAFADTAWDLTLSWLALVEGPVLVPAVGSLGALALLLALLLRDRLASLGLALLALSLRPIPTELRVTFPAIGQGDAALIEGADVLLVDGGPPGDRLLRWLRRRGVVHLDEVVLSHPHPDHYGGLVPVLEELEVDALRLPRVPLEGEDDYAALVEGARARGVAVLGPAHPTLPGWRVLHPSPGFILDHLDDANESSLVMELSWGRRRLLFTGDIERDAEAVLVGLVREVDVLKVAHHGSRTSSSGELVEVLDPALSVISCGRWSRFGHPHAATLGALRHSRVLRTDQGSVQIASDGLDLRWRQLIPGSGWTSWLDVPARTPPSATAPPPPRRSPGPV